MPQIGADSHSKFELFETVSGMQCQPIVVNKYSRNDSKIFACNLAKTLSIDPRAKSQIFVKFNLNIELFNIWLRPVY